MEKKTCHINDLRNWEKNPRRIEVKDFERLKKQIKRLGMYKPLLVTDDGVVIGGNMRLRALRDMGYTHVWIQEIRFLQNKNGKWCAEIDGVRQQAEFASKEQAMLEYSISDNDPAGYYDKQEAVELLLPLLQMEEMRMYKLSLGKPTSIRDLVSYYAPTADEDEFDPEPPVKPKSKRGEVYQLGEHRLMCGDATSQGEMASMVFTDPPYNIDYQGGMGASGQNRRKGILNDKMTGVEFYEFLNKAIANMMRYTQNAFYVCMSSSELDTLKVAFESNGGHYQSFIIWVKDAFTISRSDWQHQYEAILYGWNGKNKKHFFAGFRDEGDVWEMVEGIKGKSKGGNSEYLVAGYKVIVPKGTDIIIQRSKKKLDIWRFDKPKRSEEHPTMKPVKLINKAIQASSSVEDIVLDPFGGSGSTLVAC